MRLLLDCTHMKLKIQLAVVDTALAGARMSKGVISAGYLGGKSNQHLCLARSTIELSSTYSHVIPSHPMAKKLLKTNRKTAAAIPACLLRGSSVGILVVPASTAMDNA